MIKRFGIGILGAGLLATIVVTNPVGAVTYPGENGIIAVERTHTSRIFTVNPASGATKRLAGAGSRQPAWSPDGKLLAYERGGYVFVAEANGKDLYHVQRGHGVTDKSPVWSADGARLAFVRTDAVSGRSAIYATRSDNHAAMTISGWSDTKNYRAPSWSPDGTQIVYEEYDATSARLLVKNMATGAVRELTSLSDVTESSNATWSPSGKKILFRDSTNELYTIWYDGTHRAVVSDGDSYNGVWSPDGTRLAFIEDPGDETVSVTDPDGTVRWVVIEKGDYSQLGPVVWSPDNTKLLITMEKAGKYDLFTLDIATGAQTLLTKDIRGAPSWQSR